MKNYVLTCLLIWVTPLAFAGDTTIPHSVDSASKENPIITEAKHIKITWQQHHDYSDIRATNERQSRFETRVFQGITQRLSRVVSPMMTKDDRLELIVTDLDLAGHAKPMFHQANGYVRVMTGLYPPTIEFDYALHTAHGSDVMGSATLKNLNYLSNAKRLNARNHFYVSPLLRHWVNDKIAPKLSQ